MSNYKLTTCTTCDLTKDWLDNLDVAHLPFNYALGDVWHEEDFGATIPYAELYRRMLDGETATTSQVSTGRYLEFFRSYLEQGLDVVHVTLSTGISQTNNSARLAAEQLAEEFPERTVYVIDSLCASSGFGLLIDRMAELRDGGMGAAELAAWAEAHRLEVDHLFYSSDLTFFVRGGRVSPLAGTIGNMLKICPLLHVNVDGGLEVKEKIRTKKRAQKRMIERMGELAEGGYDYAGKVFISHSDCLEDAQAVAAAIEEQFPSIAGGKVHIFDIGATIGCHTGPGTIALFFWGDPNRW